MIQLISIHIPKTGGTTFYNILQQIYGSQLSPSYQRKDFKEGDDIGQLLEQSIYEKLKVVHGHLHYSELKLLHKNSDAKVICWMRDPVDRLISNYNHFIKRNSLNNPIRPKQHRTNESLLTFAQRKGTQNIMSQFLDGIELDELFFIGFLETFDCDINKLSGQLDWPKFSIPRLNAMSQENIKISEETRQEIRSLNKKDYDLYLKALAMKKNIK